MGGFTSSFNIVPISCTLTSVFMTEPRDALSVNKEWDKLLEDVEYTETKRRVARRT